MAKPEDTANKDNLEERATAPNLPEDAVPVEDVLDDADTKATETEAPDEEIADDESDEPEKRELPEVPEEPKTPKIFVSNRNVFYRAIDWFRAHKIASYVLVAIIILAALFGVPKTRYVLAGTVLKQDFPVAIVDQTTKKPITNATVELAGVAAKTDNKGRAILHTKVGNHKLSITKPFYKTATQTVLVPILHPKKELQVLVTATGRQVPISVIDKLSGKPIENALVKAEGSEARTDKKGEAIMVLPADKAAVDARITVDNYNTLKASLVVTEQADAKNTFNLTPTGKLYFLSKLSGKIDIVKTNLDGTERQTVLAGTGNEDNYNTVLLASRDWKYLVLQAKRDNGLPKLYLIDTASDKVTTIDEGNATFTPVGWYGNRFVYLTYRNGVKAWQPYGQALKSYDAVANKLNVIDQTAGEGTSDYDYANSFFTNVYILENELVYAKGWQSTYYSTGRLSGKAVSLFSVKPDGTGKKTVKDFAIAPSESYVSLDLRLYEPGGLYVHRYEGSDSGFYKYEDAKITKDTSLSNADVFNKEYPTYLISPTGSASFWSESRDGKYTLFVGDAEGKNGKQIATLSPYTAYGWYTDDYLLVSKGGSELYVMSKTGDKVTKVTDYHKPANDFRGYGYGYGGL